MKIKLSLLALLMFSISYAQINFEPGFIIDRTGNKISCFIRNLDWSNNPKTIEYKINQDSGVLTKNSLQIKAFQIGNKVRYISSNVDVDQSSTKLSNLSNSENPDFKKETTFLRELVSGTASLFLYSDNDKQLFFYSINDSGLLPLVNKKYFLNNQTVAENNSYKKTLFDNLKCESLDAQKIRKVNYNEGSMVKLFSSFNICKTGENTTYEGEIVKGRINLSAKLGASFTNLEVDFDQGQIGTDLQSASFSNEVTLRFGIELEYILPFNRNKWSLFIEPTYLSYSSTADISVQRTSGLLYEDMVRLDYKAIEFPIGLRHYMFLNDKSKLFIDLAFVGTNDLSDTLEYERSPDLDIKSGTSGFVGFGYNYDNKFSVEARTYFPRDITSTYPFFNSPLTMSGIILGYQFL